MYLKKLNLSNFRSCRNTSVNFQKDLTVLVGENNGGKSNIIDALRLLTLPLNGRRERYAEEADIRHEVVPPSFQITGEYDGLSDTLKGLLISAMPDPTKSEAIFGCRYYVQTSGIRGRFSSWVGKFDSTEPEIGSTDLIRHVYLPPLRDAHQALGSGSPARIMTLLHHFMTEAETEEFIESVKRPGTTTPDVLVQMNSEIGGALTELTGGIRPQSAKVDFGNENIQDVARDLRFKLGDSGVTLSDIRASGLGFSNLLYMATVVVELAKAKEADLTLFLVEEPEAHLHPQLQMLVLEFLLSKARESSANVTNPGEPEGKIQVIVSTHSPNLTAWVSPTHLVAVRSQIRPGESSVETVCIPIANLGLGMSVLNKIHRYLDVTKSAMLFGNHVALVEGIAEALLLPILADKIVLAGNREAWLRFRGTPLIPIDGVDFEPYLEILLKSHEEARIADHVVIVTDGDPETSGSGRKTSLETFAVLIGAPDNLNVFASDLTLEADLLAAGNATIMKDIFLKLRPRSVSRWTSEVEGKPVADQPKAFMDLMESTRIRKGDFAQELAGRIEAGEEFVVPPYIDEAIKKIAEHDFN